MIGKLCANLTEKIRKKMPEVDDERAEVIEYGLKLMIGEVPKLFVVMIVAHLFGMFGLTMAAFLLIMPYRVVSGGVHLKTHIRMFDLYNGVLYRSSGLRVSCRNGSVYK